MYILLALLALSALIIVHESGHYFVARWSGMRVERFSLGFGPALVKWRHRYKGTETQFQIAPLLFGGFVHIVGMNPHEEYDEKDPNVYPNRPTILRFLTILAGPVTNMLFGIVLVFFVYAFAGVAVPRVTAVTAGTPAESVLLPEDVITAVDGEPIEVDYFSARVAASQGAPMHLTVLRNGEARTVDVAARLTASGDWRIGVAMAPAEPQLRQEVGLGEAVVLSFRFPIKKSQMILGGFWEIITGKAEPDASGVVAITGMIGTTIKRGWIDAFEFLAILNVYLCLFNLLPLPALDGGRLVFLGYELATRRRPNPKIEAAVHMAGFVVLFLLMIVVTFKDVKQLILR